MEFDKILEFSDNELVSLAKDFKNEIGKNLALGMTAYQCKYGTLAEGHEKLTDAQRYFQSIKEMWYVGNNISDQKAIAMEAQADLIEAEEALAHAESKAQELRAESKILRAKTRLTQCLVQIEDSMRCLKAFDEVRRELKPVVEQKYPLGIEQAEEDNWTAVAKYRAFKRAIGYNENLTHIPLTPKKKEEISEQFQIHDFKAVPIALDKKKLMINNGVK